MGGSRLIGGPPAEAYKVYLNKFSFHGIAVVWIAKDKTSGWAVTLVMLTGQMLDNESLP